MNKKIKFGFSLAEVLVALAIISVIATMGFSIAKKGIADAYQGYYYSGYLGLDSALKIAKKEIYDDDYPNKPNTATELQKNFIEHLVKTLNLKEVDDEDSTDQCTTYIAPNSIKYTVCPNQTPTDLRMNIDMIVPSVRTEHINNTHRIVELKYDPDFQYLIPRNCEKNGNYTSCQDYDDSEILDGYVSIANRKDLIAFSYDDGTQQPYQGGMDCDENNENCEIKEPTKNEDYYNPIHRGYGSFKDTLGNADRQNFKIRLVNPKYAY